MTGDARTKFRCIGYVLGDKEVAGITTVGCPHVSNKLIPITEFAKSVLVLGVEGEDTPHWESFGADSAFEVISGQLIHIFDMLPLERPTPGKVQLLCQAFAIKYRRDKIVEAPKRIQAREPHLLRRGEGRVDTDDLEPLAYYRSFLRFSGIDLDAFDCVSGQFLFDFFFFPLGCSSCSSFIIPSPYPR